MKFKSNISKLIGVFLILVAILQFSGSTGSAAASTASGVSGSISQDGGVTSSPTGPDLTATRPWTRAEMLAAKPYPLEGGKTNALPTVGQAAADGPAGSVSGGRPAAAAPLRASGTPEDLFAAASPDLLAAYAYPPPFTRQDLRNITTPYTKYPFIAIGKLFFKQKGGNFVCSASVIGTSAASHAIITAGHCLHAGDGLGTSWSTNVVFVPAYNNGIAPYGQWTAIFPTERVFTSWMNSGDLARDVAGAKLNRNALGQTIDAKVGWLGFAWNFSRNNAWWQIGYPQATPFDGKWMIACQASYAYDSPFGTTPKPMGVGCDQTGGTSGGPWVLSMGRGDWVNGVQSHRRTGFNSEMYSPYFDATVKTALFDVLVVP